MCDIDSCSSAMIPSVLSIALKKTFAIIKSESIKKAFFKTVFAIEDLLTVPSQCKQHYLMAAKISCGSEN